MASLEAANAAMMAATKPVLVVRLVMPVLGERLGGIQVLGAWVVLSAIVVFQWSIYRNR
jgi:drug/metabolite transporter (DMT)-like permease